MKVNMGKYPSSGERKINVHIEKFDSWSVDSTLAYIILPLLIQLKHTMHGVPNDFTSFIGSEFDDNYSFDFIRDDVDKVFDSRCTEWNDTLDKMIWSFLQLSLEGDYDSKYHHGIRNTEWVNHEHVDPVTGKTEIYSEMIDKNPKSHWYDKVGHRLHNDRIQEGLDLFAKHYGSLWD